MFFSQVFGEESTPTQALDNFIALFNDENLDGLNQVSNAPWFTMVNGDSNSFSRYSDMVDFEGLKKTGWSYSRVENIDVLHDDGETAFVKALLEMNNRTPRVGPRCVQNARVCENALGRSVRHRLLPQEENASSPQDAPLELL